MKKVSKQPTLRQIKLCEMQIAQHQSNFKTVDKKQHASTRNKTTVTMTRLVSIRVARRCDDTVDKKQVNCLCTKTPLLKGVQEPRNRQKNLEKLSPTLMSRFQKTALRAILMNEFITEL